MRKKLLKHPGLKLLSLVFAFVVWLAVANVDDYKTTKQITGIEIEFVNGIAITEKNKVYEVPEGKTIDIVVKGRRNLVEGLTKDDFKAVADLSKMSITNAVAVNVSAVSALVDKEITLSYQDSAVVVDVEDKVTKQLPITVQTVSSVQEGYAISNKSATPNLITIEGGESIVNTIEQVAVNIDVAGANHNIVAYGEPIFLDYAGNKIEPSKFEYDVTSVEVNIEIKKTKELKVKVRTVGDVRENYQIKSIDYQPTHAVVVGDKEDLDKVDEILIDDIDVTNCNKDLETSVFLADYLPTGIVVADETEEIMIKVIIEELKEKKLQIKNDKINIVGKKDDFSYSFTQKDGVSVVAKGLKDDLDALKIANLIPSIDVSGYGPGIYKLKVNFREINGIIIEGEYEIELEIKDDSKK